MLSIGALSGWAGSYYTNLASEDYYLKGGEPPGTWIGSGSKELGLSGVVNADDLSNLLAGFSADGKSSLVKNAGASNRREGWDLTFTVPKSVSEVWACSDDKTRLRIQHAVDIANRKALSYVENEASFTRTGSAGSEVKNAKLVIASFEHGTSRSGDPNLHRHNLVINTCVGEDGKTRTLKSLPLYEHKMVAGAIFRSELAYQLEQDLGLLSRKHERCFELEGVPKELMREHSKRREEIESHLADSGYSSSAAADIANFATRSSKESRPRIEFLKEWQAVGKEHGFGEESVRALRKEGVVRDKEGIFNESLDKALTRLTDNESYFAKKDIVRFVAEESQHLGLGADYVIKNVEHVLENSPGIVSLGRVGTTHRYTTPDVLQNEKIVLSRLIDSKSREGAIVCEESREAVITELLPSKLTGEQLNAFNHVTTAPGSIKVVSGMAGTGKSFMLRAAKDAFQKDGYEVLGACLAGRTAEELGIDTGIKTSTISSLIYKIENGYTSLNSKTVLIIDEAGMVGTKSFEQLTKVVADAKATLLLTGDANQLQPIEAGGMFPRIAKEVGEVTLTNITRQEPDIDAQTGELSYWKRDAVKSLAAGKASEVLEEYATRGLLSIGETENKAMEVLVDDWASEGLLNPTKNVIFVNTNLEATKINRLCQEKMRELHSNHGSEAVIKHGTNNFFTGDRVLFTEKSKLLGIQNGNLGTILATDKDLKTIDVKLDSERTISVPLELYSKVKLGYAVTTHKGQGGTFDNVFVLLGGSMQDRHISYVQGSRSRLQTRFYTTAPEAGSGLTTLARKMSRERMKDLAHDVIENQDSSLSIRTP